MEEDKETLIEQNKENNGNLINNNINTNTNNEGIINTNINLVVNPDQQNKNEVLDYLITIQYSKCLHIPYFYFKNIFHFYFPCQSFPSNQIKLSEIPTPPFAVIRTECKCIFLTIIF